MYKDVTTGAYFRVTSRPEEKQAPASASPMLNGLKSFTAERLRETAPIIWVQGEEAAKSYLCAPGNSVLLMDSEKSSFYIKTVDASGMPQPLRIFDYTERTAAQKQPTQAAQAQAGEFVTRAEFDALAARFDALAADKPLTKKKESENAKSTV